MLIEGKPKLLNAQAGPLNSLPGSARPSGRAGGWLRPERGAPAAAVMEAVAATAAAALSLSASAQGCECI